MRNATTAIVSRFEQEALPFRVFETFRSPARQEWLYGQGRNGDTRRVVTHAKAWESYHQYGLAVDFVLWINTGWSWTTAAPYGDFWNRLQKIGQELGLEGLSFEQPHLQVRGLNIRDLEAGILPAGGDSDWSDNFEGAVAGWRGQPPAPPIQSLKLVLPAT